MSLARAAMTRVGRDRVFRRRLPRHLGGARFYASTEGGLKYAKRNLGAIDPVLTGFAVAHVKAGDMVWDIGANLGLFAFTAAGIAGPTGKVLCLEPDAWLTSVLRRSAKLNAGTVAPVEVLSAAVSDTSGVLTFEIAGGNRATNALAGHGYEGSMGGVREVQHVVSLTLDTLLETFGAPSVVKIDVEGVEARVLRGAERILSEARPVINVEVGSENADEVARIFSDHRYELYDGETRQRVTEPSWTTIAVPLD